MNSDPLPAPPIHGAAGEMLGMPDPYSACPTFSAAEPGPDPALNPMFGEAVEGQSR